MGSALKGGVQITDEMFWTIIIVLALIVFLAIAILLSGYILNYVSENINSEEKICDTFEKSPLFGTIRCERTFCEDYGEFPIIDQLICPE